MSLKCSYLLSRLWILDSDYDSVHSCCQTFMLIILLIFQIVHSIVGTILVKLNVTWKENANLFQHLLPPSTIAINKCFRKMSLSTLDSQPKRSPLPYSVILSFNPMKRTVSNRLPNLASFNAVGLTSGCNSEIQSTSHRTRASVAQTRIEQSGLVEQPSLSVV